MSSEQDINAWVYGCTDVGMVRRNNEDAFVIVDLTTQTGTVSAVPAGAPIDTELADTGSEGSLKKCTLGPQGLLMAVSDGMGGAEAGEIASYLVVESLRTELTGVEYDKPTAHLVREAVERANNIVWDAAAAPNRAGMGATLTAALVRGDRAYIAGVGDSRCYVIRGRRIRQVTRDQSLVESLVELGHITREEAEQSPHRNIILQAIGTRPSVAVALARLQLFRGDMLLLCSDGLSGKLSAEEMRDMALAGPTIEEACKRMVACAKERGGEDNITAILSHFTGPGLGTLALGEGVTATLTNIHKFNHATGTGYDERESGEQAPVTRPLASEAGDE